MRSFVALEFPPHAGSGVGKVRQLQAPREARTPVFLARLL
jgi:hypothetical protein